MPTQLTSEQYGDDWFELRKGKVSASIIGSVLGLPGAFSSREAQLRSIVRGYFGILRNENRGSPAMDWGMKQEAKARAEFEFDQDVTVIQHGMYAHDQYPWLVASPDGQIEGEDVGLEIKCPYHYKFEANDVPAHEVRELSKQKIRDTLIDKKPIYYAQMQIQMQVMGWKAVYYVVWTPCDMSVEYVSLDQEWFDKNLPAIQAFYAEVEAAIADPKIHNKMLEDDEVDLSDDLAWCTHTMKLAGIHRQISDLKEEETKLKDALVTIAQVHNKTCKGGGYSVIRKSGTRRVDYKAALEVASPGFDLTPYTKAGDATWAVTPQKSKESK